MLVKNYRPAGVGMFPAEPGTYLLHAYFEGDQPELVKANVIGWQVTNGRNLDPLVIDPRAAEITPWTVGHPDGRVECSDGRCWNSIEQWLNDESRPSPQPTLDHITAALPPSQIVERVTPPPMPVGLAPESQPEPGPKQRNLQSL